MAFWKTKNNKTDPASAYIKKRGTVLYIGDMRTKNIISFKAFLKSFSLNYKPSFKSEETPEGRLEEKVEKTHFTYSISIDVPSYNEEEAKWNDSQYYKLEDMVRRIYTQDKSQKISKDAMQFRILLRNLIYNGNYSTIPKEVGSFGRLSTYAMEGAILEVKREIDVEAGFFESESGTPYPKAYSISFDYLVSNTFTLLTKKGDLEGNAFLPWKVVGGKVRSRKNDSFGNRDKENWPFGYNKGRYYWDNGWGDGISPVVKQYLTNKPNSKFHIGFTFDSLVPLKKIWFPCFLESAGQSFGVGSSDEFGGAMTPEVIFTHNKWKQRQITFSVPFYSERDSRTNMEKIGVLWRSLLLTGDPSKPNNYLFFKFGNFIKGANSQFKNSARCNVRSCSVDFDLDLGFWEELSGNLLPKGIKLSFDLEII